MNTERKLCTRFDDPEAMRSFVPLAVTPSGHGRKNGIFFFLSLRGFSTLGSIRPLECP